VDLDINKTTGFTATANGTVNVGGNLTVTSGTLSFASSTFTVTGTTDIYDTVTDTSGGGAGGNNVFVGLVTVRPGGIWLGVIGEVCDFHFGNGLAMNGASFVSSTGIYYFETNSQSITGSSSFTIDNLSVTSIQLTNNSTGTLTVAKILSGTGEFIQGASTVLNIAGTSTITTLTPTGAGNTVNYTGTAAQTVHSGTYRTLTVNGNTNGSVNITADTTANTALTLGATKLSTSTNKMILGNTVSVTRTSGYVIGTIEKKFNASGSFTYDIGDASNYTPIDLTLTGVTGTGSVDGSVTNTDHSDISNSGIDSTKSVNRYFTLVNNSVGFTTYAPTFHFVSGDVDAGSNVADMTIAKNSAGTWSTLSSTCSGTSCSATGLTSMSDFQIGVSTSSVSSSNSTSSSTSSSSSTTDTTTSASSSLFNALSPLLGDFGLVTPPLIGGIPGSSALFDVISTPLFGNFGNVATPFPVIAFAFLIGSFIGLFLILAWRRRHARRRRRSRVLRIIERRRFYK
jgi:hypothetical protein